MNAAKGKASRPVVKLKPLIREWADGIPFGPAKAAGGYVPFELVSASGDPNADNEQAREFSQRLLEDAKIREDLSIFACRRREIEEGIAKTGRRDLEALERAGVGRKTLLHLLSFAAMSGEEEWRRVLRGKIAGLRSLVRQLQTLACHVERMALDPLCYANTWGDLVSASLEWDPFFDIHQLIPVGLFRSMNEYAETVRAHARELGRFLRRAGIKERRRVILLLLHRIEKSAGRDCDPELARLLTDAFQAAGKPTAFSADQLRKYRDRYVNPLLASRHQDKPTR